MKSVVLARPGDLSSRQHADYLYNTNESSGTQAPKRL